MSKQRVDIGKILGTVFSTAVQVAPSMIPGGGAIPVIAGAVIGGLAQGVAAKEIAVVPIKPAVKSKIVWGSVVGAAATFGTVLGSGFVPAPILDAADALGVALGVPPKVFPAVIILGAFGWTAWAKIFGTTSITPSSAQKLLTKAE